METSNYIRVLIRNRPKHLRRHKIQAGFGKFVTGVGEQLQNFSTYLLQLLEFLSSQLISIVNMSETQNLRTMSQNN